MLKIIMFASQELTDIFRKYPLKTVFTGHDVESVSKFLNGFSISANIPV